MIRSVLNLTDLATIGYYCVVGYVLLHPEKGTGIFDTTLFEATDYASMWLFIVILFFMCLLLLKKDNVTQNKTRLICGILALFSLIVILRSPITYRNEQALLAINICLGPSCFLVFYLFLQRSRILRAFPYLLIVVLVVYSLTILHALFISHRPQINETLYYFGNAHRLCVVFDHPNHLGNLLAFGVVLLFASAALTSMASYRLIQWIMLICMMIGLVATLSRGAWFGCLIGLSMCIIYLWKHISPRRLINSIIALILITAGAICISGHMKSVSDRWTTTLPSKDASVGNRLLVWHRTSNIIRDHWLIGVGIGQFGKALDYTDIADILGHERYDSALNNYLNLAAEAGVPTLVLYLLCVFYACKTASNVIFKRNGTISGANLGLLCGVYSILIFGLTTYTLARLYANILMWSSLGYLTSLRK